MTILEFYRLVVLLIKYRSIFAISHKKRDLIDEILLDILERLSPLVMEPPQQSDIPF